MCAPNCVASSQLSPNRGFSSDLDLLERSEKMGSGAGIDYSAWDRIDVSDDEDATSPFVDTPSLFRMRHRVSSEISSREVWSLSFTRRRYAKQIRVDREVLRRNLCPVRGGVHTQKGNPPRPSLFPSFIMGEKWKGGGALS